MQIYRTLTYSNYNPGFTEIPCLACTTNKSIEKAKEDLRLQFARMFVCNTDLDDRDEYIAQIKTGNFEYSDADIYCKYENNHAWIYNIGDGRTELIFEGCVQLDSFSVAENEAERKLEYFQSAIEYAKMRAENNKEFYFVHNGQDIYNPWLDPTGRYQLSDSEAVRTYGYDNVVKFIEEINVLPF